MVWKGFPSLRSSSCLGRKPPRAPQLEETPETPPSSRAEGAFELWCWRRLLRVPWTARRSNQSILTAPEKSGLHACGQADRVIALESWEGLGPQDAFNKDSRGLSWVGVHHSRPVPWTRQSPWPGLQGADHSHRAKGTGVRNKHVTYTHACLFQAALKRTLV